MMADYFTILDESIQTDRFRGMILFEINASVGSVSVRVFIRLTAERMFRPWGRGHGGRMTDGKIPSRGISTEHGTQPFRDGEQTDQTRPPTPGHPSETQQG